MLIIITEVTNLVEYISKDGYAVAVQFGKARFPLKKPLKFSELEKYTSAIDKAGEIVDFGGKVVDDSMMADFVLGMWPSTKDYLTTLLSEDRWFTSAELQKKLNVKPQGIAGIRAGLTKRAESLGMDYVDDNDWINEEGQNKFKIKDNYREALKRALITS